MKKILLSAAAVLLGAGAAYAGANVYASSLKLDSGKVSFVLNDDATMVVFNIIENGHTVASADLGAGIKGLNTFDVPSFNVAPGTYQWSITASADANTEVVQLTDGTDENLQTSSGRGIAVDMFPSSPAFGNVYVVSPATAGQPGARVEVGMYVFNAAMQPVNATPYTGGIEWEKGNSNPNNVDVAENGQVFICSWADGQGGVYVADPDNLAGNWTSVFADGERDDKGLVTIDGAKVHGSVQDVALYGSGDARMMYTTDEDMNDNNGDIMVYNIGTLSNPWNTAPTADWGHDAGYVNANHRLASDQRGGLWLGQYRWQESAANACVYHINAKGEWEFHTGDKSIFLGSTPAGAIACNADGSLLACVGGDNGKSFVVAKAVYDENGLPELEKYCEFTYTGYGTRPMAAAFDAADNLYVIFNNADNTGGVAVFALPAEKNEYTTPATSDIEISTSGIVEVSVAGYTFAGGIITAETGASVYTITGVKVAEGTVIDTSTLASGVYAVRTDKATFKIVK